MHEHQSDPELLRDDHVVVLRLGRVPFMDATGLNTLSEIIGRLRKRHVHVLLCGIHPTLRHSLDAWHHRTGRRDELRNNMHEVAQRVSNKWGHS